MVADDVAMLGDVDGSSIVGDDHSNSRERFLQVRQKFGYAIPNPDVSAGGGSSKPQRNDNGGWNGHSKRDHREQWVVNEHHGGDNDQGEALYQEVDDAVLEQNRQRLDIRRHPSEEYPGFFVRVVVDALALHVAEHLYTKRLVEPLAEASGERHTNCAHDRRQHDGTYVCTRSDHEYLLVADPDTLIDPDLGEDRTELQRNGFDGYQHRGQRQAAPVRPQKSLQREWVMVPIGVRPRNRVDCVLGLVKQHVLNFAPQIPRHLGMRQAGCGARLRRGRSAAEASASSNREHQTIRSVVEEPESARIAA